MPTPSAILYEEDLLALEKLITRNASGRFDSISYQVQFEHIYYEAESMRELIDAIKQDNLRESAKELVIKAKGPKGQFVMLPLGNKAMRPARVEGLEVDVFGHMSLIRDFLGRRSPWYAWLFPTFKGGMALFILIFVLNLYNTPFNSAPWPFPVLFAFGAALSLVLTALGLCHYFLGLFPHQRVYLMPDPRRGWTLEHYGLVVAILSLFAALYAVRWPW